MSKPSNDNCWPNSPGLALPDTSKQRSDLPTTAGKLNEQADNSKEEHSASIPELFSEYQKSKTSADHYYQREPCCSPLVLVLILIVAMTSLVLMVLVCLEHLGPQCECSEGKILKLNKCYFVLILSISMPVIVDNL